jgi:hypothetical protein
MPQSEALRIHTRKGVFYDYGHVDFNKCNDISNDLYTQLQVQLHKAGDGISVDEVTVIVAMMAKRMAVTCDLAANYNRPEGARYAHYWDTTMIHDFCSMLIPESGLVPGKVVWKGEDGSEHNDPPPGSDYTVKEVERAIREQYPASDPVSLFKNDLHRPAKPVHNQRDRERDYVARKFEQSSKEADKGQRGDGN